ncbi:MAG: hypothetical protein GYA17_08065 [Chloroflexi bacterium]|jgi:cytochrome bd-type quinol oxidase subunit 2|nr:hypothetical protein [Anaerolineaceae bacterium]NMB88302.1 hypothetical protein [Chloroflexota bacterium]
MTRTISTAVAIAVGLIILVGYFVPVALVPGVRETLLDWAIILAGVATLVGVLNLVAVHWNKMNDSRQRDLYSPFLLVAFVVTVLAGLWLSPADERFQQVVTSIQVPVETSLLAILAITLAFASLRLLQRKRNVMTIVFVISVVVFLLLTSGALNFLQGEDGSGGLLGSLNRLPLAGARGILLGVALGSLTTGLRILLGADRPYSG